MLKDREAKITRGEDAVEIESVDDVGGDKHRYRLQFSPFRIQYYINRQWVMEVNSKVLLYFESPNNVEAIDVSIRFNLIIGKRRFK